MEQNRMAIVERPKDVNYIIFLQTRLYILIPSNLSLKGRWGDEHIFCKHLEIRSFLFRTQVKSLPVVTRPLIALLLRRTSLRTGP